MSSVVMKLRLISAGDERLIVDLKKTVGVLEAILFTHLPRHIFETDELPNRIVMFEREPAAGRHCGRKDFVELIGTIPSLSQTFAEKMITHNRSEILHIMHENHWIPVTPEDRAVLVEALTTS